MLQNHVEGARFIADRTATANEGSPGTPARILLLSAADVALMLNVSTRTVWRLDAAGKLPKAVAVGGLKRWRREELAAWIVAGCPTRSTWQWGLTLIARSSRRFVEGRK